MMTLTVTQSQAASILIDFRSGFGRAGSAPKSKLTATMVCSLSGSVFDGEASSAADSLMTDVSVEYSWS